MSIYDYSVPTPKGEEISLRDYEGKVILIVNTATGCGFTPHYKPIEQMYEDLHDKGFEVIDVPCNQFAGQTPGTDEEVHEFCRLKYHTQFPQMKKSDVNGENALPLFKFLKSQKDQNNPEIKWNFTKFVVDRQGNVVKRFEPTAEMKEVRAFVESLI